MSVELRRIYEESSVSTGHRVLVDRLWPRGVTKADANIDEWAKEAAPSTALRRWYGHDVALFDEFAHRYRDELRRDPAAEVVARLRKLSHRRRLVLLTATRDVDHSAAKVLYDLLTDPTTG